MYDMELIKHLEIVVYYAWGSLFLLLLITIGIVAYKHIKPMCDWLNQLEDFKKKNS